MKRIDFIKSLLISPLIFQSMNLNALHQLTNLSETEKMPVLFLGHGNPMNAIEENEFVNGFRNIGKTITAPKAIICISAHWETKGTFVTAMKHPRTIHDFGGFPKELFDVQYPAPGSPELANSTQQLITKTNVQLDENWGLDHGAWSVLKHLYPDANVPIIQLSLDYSQPASYHFELAKELNSLRKKGILLVGSGNIVHNLGMVAWDKLSGAPYAYDWAVEANEKIKANVLKGDFQNLIDFKKQGKEFELAIPTPEHYLPLLYTLALKDEEDSTVIFNDQPVAGSLFMTSFKFG